ncbi:alpha/beta fold hydrolase [Parasphingopyxis lamellibrachiae]|uniref:Pimeloyl-ACP methyl ester carboxylesterase n=1 Tax=Parasphingopyxis lamellibrachiae TaxID=680125 RepID=A0A3D9FDB3_9SPHN|nr:alpha/beta hydrolase [Parasphingopyxis lamellibrachiae]RED15051.1 pimeloyl-ACP methyl ester carboxylesterase [Parasphingopyxis lamellibrachiae]
MKRFFKWAALILLILIGGAVFWFWTPDRDVDDLRARYTNEASQFIELPGGLTVHVRDEGPRDAPVLVLVHGSSASLQTWEPWVERLSDDYRIVTYDQPGHGLTGPTPDGDYNTAVFVETLDGVANALDLGQFAVGGSSMGGWVSWNYALAHGNRLTGLALIGASGVPDAQPRSLPIGFRIAQMPVISRLMEKITPRSMVERSIRESVSNDDIVDDVMVDRYYDLLLYPGNRAATGARGRAERTVASPETMAQITVPTLLIWGEEDPLVPLSSGQWFDDHIPDSVLIAYPDIGHIPMEEAPDRSAADMRAWLDRLYVSEDSQAVE